MGVKLTVKKLLLVLWKELIEAEFADTSSTMTNGKKIMVRLGDKNPVYRINLSSQ